MNGDDPLALNGTVQSSAINRSASTGSGEFQALPAVVLLCNAAQRGDEGQVKRLFQTGRVIAAGQDTNSGHAIEPNEDSGEGKQDTAYLRCSPSEPDASGATALHWCVSGNHYRVAEYLLLQGADVDARGGDLAATPIHWAVRQGHIQMVTLLVKYSADVYALDGQGYMPIHVAAQGDDPLMFLYIVSIMDSKYDSSTSYQNTNECTIQRDQYNVNYVNSVPADLNSTYSGLETNVSPCIDYPDSQGRSPLIWIAYMGKSTTMLQACLRLGANLYYQDAYGCTALSWSILEGHKTMTQRLLAWDATKRRESSGNPPQLATICDKYGKTPIMQALEKGTETVKWLEPILYRAGYEKEVSRNRRNQLHSRWLPTWCRLPRIQTLNMDSLRRIAWVLGFMNVFFALYILSTFIFVFAAAAIFVAYLLQSLVMSHALQSVLTTHSDPRADDNPFIRTPILTALYQSTMIIVHMYYFFTLVPDIVTLYHYAMLLAKDPGFLPINASMERRHETVLSLANDGALDPRHFCITCMIRKPLRSKHCKVSDRCVACFDHYCPWVNTTVGLGNHRHFVLYLIFGMISMVLFVCIVFHYFGDFAPSHHVKTMYPRESRQSIDVYGCILPPALCSIFELSSGLFYISAWISFCLLWISVLVCMQIYQIGIGLTTNELTNWTRLSYLSQIRSIDDDPYQDGSSSSEGPSTSDDDIIVVTSRRRDRAERNRRQYTSRSNKVYHNPFNLGVIANILDFFDLRRSAFLSQINWYTLYDIGDVNALQSPGAPQTIHNRNLGSGGQSTFRRLLGTPSRNRGARGGFFARWIRLFVGRRRTRNYESL